jgi:hypothetical protein
MLKTIRVLIKFPNLGDGNEKGREFLPFSSVGLECG